MAKPNYQFQRRQKDLARRKKQEEKRLKKQAKRDAASGEIAAEPQTEDVNSTDQGNTP